MEKVKQFYEALANNEAMKEKAAKLNEGFGGEAPDEGAANAAIIAFAKSEGYNFTAEELAEYAKTVKPEKLTDEELEAVAGGFLDDFIERTQPICWYGCNCIAGGSGVHDSPKITCWCVIAGWGGVCEHGYKLVCSALGFTVEDFEFGVR